VYLSEVMGVEPDFPVVIARGVFSQELRKKVLLKQAALLEGVEDSSSLMAALNEELDGVFDSVRRGFPCLSDADAGRVFSEVMADLGAFFDRLNYMAEDMGFERALSKMTPWMVDYKVSSNALGLSGRIDKVMKEQTYCPVEIKTCAPPESVWEGDRLQVCAYGLLLEESLSLERIPYGFAEYTRVPEMRPIMFTDILRRKVLDTRDSVCSLLKGDIPDICPMGMAGSVSLAAT